MTPTYRIRYSLTQSRSPIAPADVLAINLDSTLDGIPALLPTGAYILEIEDLTARQTVHWTRWPRSYRPGFNG